jgi:hypothetical protein
VTLPRPDLPIVLLSHHGPVSFGRDESGRTANRGAGGLVTALIGANVGPPRRRLGMRAATDEDPLSLASTTTSVQHHPGARAAAPRPGRARLSGAPGSHRSAAPGRGRPPGPWPAMSRTEPCCGDSCTAWRWDRVAAVIDQLDVRGVLSVPVQSDGRSGRWMSMPPAAAWSGGVDGARSVCHPRRRAGPYGRAELVSRDLEMAQLRQALTSRISIEQAKGVLAASQEVTPDEGFQQLRARARSSSRKLADLAREVVQQAQRERVAALPIDDARVRVAEARAQAAEQALQAGPNRADPTYRGPGPSPRRPGRTGASRRTERLAGGWPW